MGWLFLLKKICLKENSKILNYIAHIMVLMYVHNKSTAS